MRRVYSISRVALGGVLSKPLRSFLTMLTAAIGIASVIATVSIINGANKVLETTLTSLGTNIIVVHGKAVSGPQGDNIARTLIRNVPGWSRYTDKTPLNMNDVRLLRQQFSRRNILVSPAVIFRANFIDDEGETVGNTVVGTEPDYFEMLPIPVIAGRLISDSESARGARVCVLDEATVYKLFGSNVLAKKVIGSRLKLTDSDSEAEFTVVGVIKDPQILRLKTKKKIDVGAIARDIQYSRLEFMNVYIPFNAVPDSAIRINAIFVMPDELDNVDRIKQEVNTYVTAARKDVMVWDQKSWIYTTLDFVTDFTYFSHYIWVMILGVAMIMIMTITLVSVRERYYEIAIRITEGATKMKILLQFAIESIFVSIVGGIIGIGLGFIIILLCEQFVIRWDAIVSYREIILAILLSFLIGILTSIPTARRAASLNPIEVFRMR